MVFCKGSVGIFASTYVVVNCQFLLLVASRHPAHFQNCNMFSFGDFLRNNLVLFCFLTLIMEQPMFINNNSSISILHHPDSAFHQHPSISTNRPWQNFDCYGFVGEAGNCHICLYVVVKWEFLLVVASWHPAHT